MPGLVGDGDSSSKRGPWLAALAAVRLGFGPRGEHEAAETSANAAATLAPELSAAWVVLGDARDALGDKPLACDAYARALQCAASDSEGKKPPLRLFVRLADLYLEVGPRAMARHRRRWGLF